MNSRLVIGVVLILVGILVSAAFLSGLGDLNPVGGLQNARKWSCNVRLFNPLALDTNFFSTPQCTFSQLMTSCNVWAPFSLFGLVDENLVRITAGSNVKTKNVEVIEGGTASVVLEGCVESSVDSLLVQILNKDGAPISTKYVQVPG